LVLECLEATEPPFSPGAVGEVRVRLIGTDLDRRLLERTVAVARQSQAVAARKLPKSLRVAFDASALEGAGRVEDTLNLLGHAARKVVACVAVLLGCTAEAVGSSPPIPVNRIRQQTRHCGGFGVAQVLLKYSLRVRPA